MSESSSPIAPDADAPCAECGQFGAVDIAGRLLCLDCLAAAGCGCAGHGDDGGS
jgi:hypothetical protein